MDTSTLERPAVAVRLNPAPAAPAAPAAAEEAARAAQRALAVQAAVLSHPRHAVAATALATELVAQFGCSRVLVGVRRGSAIELVAVSHGGGDALVGEAFDAIAAAADEALQQGCSLYLPSGERERVLIRLAHQRWQQRQGGSVLTVPLVHGGQVTGALACEWVAARTDLATLAAQVEDVAAFVGPVLALLHERDLPVHRRAWQRLREAVAGLRRPGRRKLKWSMAAVAVALLGTTLVPVSHEVAGRARVEGEQQRALAAPADGFVKAVHARPGDAVRAGQVLVELADQDLLLERQRWASEQGQQESAYAAAMARADRAQMVIAMAKAEQARAQLAKTEAQLQRATVVAPFDGIVIQGDLSQAVGAPVERGKPLLTLAPDARYRIVVEVDERDIAAVAAGQTGALSLASLPWQRLPLTVTRVTPVAHATEGRNVFEVEAAVQAGDAPVRPGLEGVARLAVGREPLAWIWTHRLVDWLRLQAWAWWG